MAAEGPAREGRDGSGRRRRVRRIPFGWRIPLLAALAALPWAALAGVLLWTGGLEPGLRWTLVLLATGLTALALTILREKLVRPLQTLANTLAALRENDYSLRATLGSPDDALGLLAHEINALGELMREKRLEALEATALLRRVMEEIDVAVFAFDGEDRLRLANRAAEELLGRSAEAMLGRSAGSLGLDELLEGESPRVTDLVFPGRASRWEIRRSTFRQHGVPHRLLVLADLSRVLREEERKAWRRLVRVLSHEINNSLAPIRSIAESLKETAAPDGREASAGWEELEQGLDVISGRSEALARFMSSYARLARLPSPELEPLEVGDWVRRVVSLEARVPVRVEEGPDLEILADGDQLDQLLINLLDNAVDAVGETDGDVWITWSADPKRLELRVVDEGPGVAETENLFVPFFTTKPEGSGIGLALSRQIAEAHGGSLTLENRTEGEGCVARLRLPRR